MPGQENYTVLRDSRNSQPSGTYCHAAEARRTPDGELSAGCCHPDSILCTILPTQLAHSRQAARGPSVTGTARQQRPLQMGWSGRSELFACAAAAFAAACGDARSGQRRACACRPRHPVEAACQIDRLSRRWAGPYSARRSARQVASGGELGADNWSCVQPLKRSLQLLGLGLVFSWRCDGYVSFVQAEMISCRWQRHAQPQVRAKWLLQPTDGAAGR